MKSATETGALAASLLLPILLVSLAASPASAATLKEVTGFGYNPSNIRMYVYVPEKVQAHPPVLVGLHWCHGTAPAFHSGTQFAAQADRYGFIVIYPNANSGDSCWDVHSQAALKHDGGSDPSGIVSMVRYAVKTYNADSTRVYAAGHSSGGMMTNVMLGSYPDLFKAGAAFAGVPFSCFSGTNSWNGDCAAGKISRTPAAWGDLVRAAYPGYAGPRPRIQLWHGTKDDVLSFNNFGEEIKQWTNVLGAGANPVSTEANTPQAGWTRTRYADASGKVQVEAIQEQDQPHNLKILADQAVRFLGLDAPATGLAGSPRAGAEAGSRASLRILRNASPDRLRFLIAARPGRLSLEVRAPDGRLIRALAAGSRAPGSWEAAWDGRTETGAMSPAGIYLVTAVSAGSIAGGGRFAWMPD